MSLKPRSLVLLAEIDKRVQIFVAMPPRGSPMAAVLTPEQDDGDNGAIP